jgi:hypothetical protein
MRSSVDVCAALKTQHSRAKAGVERACMTAVKERERSCSAVAARTATAVVGVSDERLVSAGAGAGAGDSLASSEGDRVGDV